MAMSAIQCHCSSVAL